MVSTDRREVMRIDVRWPVRVLHLGRELAVGETANISLNGMLFVTSRQLPLGRRVRIDVELDTGRWVSSMADIVREEPASLRRYAYGVHLVWYGEEDGEAFRERVRALRCDAEPGDSPHFRSAA